MISVRWVFLAVLVAVQAQATENQIFKVSLGPGWVETKAGQDDSKYYYSYGNREEKAWVLFHVAKRADKRYTKELSEKLIIDAQTAAENRGAKVQQTARYKARGCTVDYLAYFKPMQSVTNVDFYMYCGGKLVRANYAMQGMLEANVDKALAIHKSFKLK